MRSHCKTLVSGADGALMCQDAVKLLHNRLERSDAVAHKLLHEHLGTILLQPRVLQLLLSSLPVAASRQKLVYCSLCRLLKPGEALILYLPLSHVVHMRPTSACLYIVLTRIAWGACKCTNTEIENYKNCDGAGSSGLQQKERLLPAESLEAVRGRAMWELGKLVRSSSGAESGE